MTGVDDASRMARGADGDETVAAPQDETVAAPLDETVTTTGPVVRAPVAGALGRSRGLQKTWMGGLSADAFSGPSSAVVPSAIALSERTPEVVASAVVAPEVVASAVVAPAVVAPEVVAPAVAPSAIASSWEPSISSPSAMAPRRTDGLDAFLPWGDAPSPVTPRYGRVVAVVAAASVVLPLVLFLVLSMRTRREPTSLTPPASASSDSIGRVESVRRRSDAVTALAAPAPETPTAMVAPPNASTATASTAPPASPTAPTAGSPHASKPAATSKPASKKKPTKRH